MVALPNKDAGQLVIDRIYEAIEKEEAKSLYLARIGASSIGDECLRSIWLSWRAYDDKQFAGRMLRLFKTGHLQEDRVLEDLKRAGFELWSHQADGKQWTYTDSTGHFVCKLDGVMRGVPTAEKTVHDLEIKTHSLSSFNDVKKKGVETAKPVHFWQMQAGMKFGKFTRALYVALCKNDEAYHVERVRPDTKIQDEIGNRINKLVEATIAPVGISDDGKSFGCKWCDMKEVCQGEKEPIRTCRSCEHVIVVRSEGAWVCGLTGKVLTKDEQKLACGDYEVLNV
mgnify:CR=1 FL=1